MDQQMQFDLFEAAEARSLLDQLLADSQLYKLSKDYLELLEFTSRLRNFAPFNAMLLHIQKPGMFYAASAHDWLTRFERTVKEGARPLLILWPFGPVALVYDVQDTAGKDLPQDVNCFVARGPITKGRIYEFLGFMESKGIQSELFDGGDGKAGSISRLLVESPADSHTAYLMHVNANHPPAVQFVTIAHELAHLFLGHLGTDKRLKIPDRPLPPLAQQELEAESVAFILSKRNEVESRSQTYLAEYVTRNTSIESLDVYQVMRAAGQIEALLRLTSHTRYEPPEPGKRRPPAG